MLSLLLASAAKAKAVVGTLPIRRAGLMTDAQFAASIGRTINAVANAPGRRFFSPTEMSLQAPFVDAATSVDPVNRANTFLSYYTWGAALTPGQRAFRAAWLGSKVAP